MQAYATIDFRFICVFPAVPRPLLSGAVVLCFQIFPSRNTSLPLSLPRVILKSGILFCMLLIYLVPLLF